MQRLKKEIGIILILTLLIFAVFGQVAGYEFLNYDDGVYILENRQIENGFSRQSISWALNNAYAANWHPLTWFSHMADLQFFGKDPAGHHGVNLLFHIINTGLLFGLLVSMTGALWRSAAVAALFGLHPLHVEPVAWVAQRKEVLSFFLGMLTLWAYRAYAKRLVKRRYATVLFFYLLTLMTKPMWVTLPLLLMLLDFWPLQRLPGAGRSGMRFQWTKWFLEKVPFLLLSVASCLITLFSQKAGLAVRTLEEYSISVRLMNAVVSVGEYLLKILWPFNLIVFYPHPGESVSLLKAIIALGGLTAATVLAIRFHHRYPWFFFGWIWYLVTLIPVIGIVQVGEQASADRYMYLPSLGVFIAMVWSGQKLKPASEWVQSIGSVAVVGFLAILSIMSWVQTRHWRNNFTLYAHALEVTPKNPLVVHNYSEALIEAGRREVLAGKIKQAVALYQRALQVKPDSAKAENSLGNVYVKQGNLIQAVRHYRQAIRFKPSHGQANGNLGLILIQLGQLDEATGYLEKSLFFNPRQPIFRNNYGLLLMRQGAFKQAIIQFQKALKVTPGAPAILFNLANAFLKMGNLDQARQHYQKALRKNPEFWQASQALERLDKISIK